MKKLLTAALLIVLLLAVTNTIKTSTKAFTKVYTAFSFKIPAKSPEGFMAHAHRGHIEQTTIISVAKMDTRKMHSAPLSKLLFQ